MNNDYNNFDPFGQNNESSDSQNKNEPIEQRETYSPSSGYYYPPQPPKPKKEKRRVSFGATIACCIICAIISGACASGAVILVSRYTADNGSASGGTTTINVDKSSTNAVSAIAQKVVPSVVGIRSTASVNSFFGFSQEASSEGSGVIFSSDGYIITNYHVVSDAVESQNSKTAGISVYLSTDPNTAIEAKVVGYNSDYDLAVLKIEKTGLTPVTLADSDQISVGDLAVAIGNPGGLEYMSSVSSGIVSGLNRTLQLEGTTQMKLIQTDAAINPGNSGGALVNYNGELVGINSSKISSEQYEGMGFAIPSNKVKEVVEDIINNKDKKYAYVGVKISTEYTGDSLKSMGYPAGAVVESVTDGSPAAEIGLAAADIITEFDGVKIDGYEQYNTERLKHKPGDKISMSVYRNGQYYDVSLTLGESNN